MAALMVPMVSAAVDDNVGVIVTGGHLIITDVDVKVDSKSDKNLDNNEKIDEEAQPGSRVEFSIKVANNFTDSDDIEIEDIEVRVTIEGIDDDDDLEEESKEFDVKADDYKRIKIEFDIPLEVDDDTFDVLIEVDGSSDNGSQEVKMDLEIEVEKEDNEVRFTRNSLTPSEIQCSRTVQLSTAVINTGSDDEDDTVLEVLNSNLGISFRETFDLSNDAFDDDSKFRKTFTITVPESVSAGVYPILSRVSFDGGSDTETETADLIVRTCDVSSTADEEEEEEEEVVVIQPQPTQPTQPTAGTAQPVTAPSLPTTEEKSLFQSSGFIVALVVGELLLVILAIIIVVSVVRKRS